MTRNPGLFPRPRRILPLLCLRRRPSAASALSGSRPRAARATRLWPRERQGSGRPPRQSGTGARRPARPHLSPHPPPPRGQPAQHPAGACLAPLPAGECPGAPERLPARPGGQDQPRAARRAGRGAGGFWPPPRSRGARLPAPRPGGRPPGRAPGAGQLEPHARLPRPGAHGTVRLAAPGGPTGTPDPRGVLRARLRGLETVRPRPPRRQRSGQIRGPDRAPPRRPPARQGEERGSGGRAGFRIQESGVRRKGTSGSGTQGRSVMCHPRQIGDSGIQKRTRGNRRTRTLDSVTVSIAPDLRSSPHCLSTWTRRSASCGAFSPSMRRRITDGPAAPESARCAWKSASRVTTIWPCSKARTHQDGAIVCS